MAAAGLAGGLEGAGGRDGDADGTNGGAEGPETPEEPGGTSGGAGDGGVNSGSPVDCDGGVAVAVTEARSTDSGLGLGAAGVSTARG